QMIPLTARGVNESFWVTTGTTKNGDVSKDILLAAQSSATIVILMAMSKLEEIMAIFSGAGKQNTPVAIIQNGTTEKEKIALGTVTDIADKARKQGLDNPAIVVIGQVVALHPDMVVQMVERKGLIS
ncbi:MAG: uroporphyrinogen-III C-methyltransferase, partial [Cytophagales bacterium]